MMVQNPSRRIVLAIAGLVLVALACTCFGTPGTNGGEPTQPPIDGGPTATAPEGGNGDIATDTPESGEPTPTPLDGGGSTETEFPLPDDVQNLMEVGGTVNFQTSASMEEMMDFYRAEFTALGYTERELLTVTSDTTFSMVFDGHASGQAIVVQGVDLGGSTNVSLRLESIP